MKRVAFLVLIAVSLSGCAATGLAISALSAAISAADFGHKFLVEDPREKERNRLLQQIDEHMAAFLADPTARSVADVVRARAR